MQSIYVPTGQRVNITLSDGTNVWLNACSEMTYPASFSEDIRRVSLKGEAYFDVSKDVEHPFVVQWFIMKRVRLWYIQVHWM